MNGTALLVGLAGGVTSALLFAAVLGGGPLASSLLFLSPLPVAISAIGWGTLSGAVAAAVAAAILAAVLAPFAGIIHVLASVGPIAWYGHLVGLARPREDGALEWYPLGRIFTAIALITPVTLAIVGWLIGFSTDSIADAFADFFVEYETASGVPPSPREDVVAFARPIAEIAPAVYSATIMSLMILNLWLAARIVQISGRLRRPWTAMAEAPELPIAILAAAAVATVLATGGGALALVMRAVAGSLGMAFVLQGCATFHVLTRGQSNRGLILTVFYFVLPLFPLLLPAIALGAADSVAGIRRRRLSKP